MPRFSNGKTRSKDVNSGISLEKCKNGSIFFATKRHNVAQNTKAASGDCRISIGEGMNQNQHEDRKWDICLRYMCSKADYEFGNIV